MSVCQDNTLEINMIRDIIITSNRGKETIKNLLKSFNMLIKVADQIIEYKDYFDKDGMLIEVHTESEDSDDSDYDPRSIGGHSANF